MIWTDFDLGAVAHDAAIPHQRVEMLLGHEGTGIRVEPIEPVLERRPICRRSLSTRSRRRRCAASSRRGCDRRGSPRSRPVRVKWSWQGSPPAPQCRLCALPPRRRFRRRVSSLRRPRRSCRATVEKGESGATTPSSSARSGRTRARTRITHQHAQQMMGEVFRRQRPCDRAVGLAGLDATEKEHLDADENAGDDLLEIRIMRRHVERRVHQHAAFALSGRRASASGSPRRSADRFARRQCFAAPDAVGDALLDIVVERPLIERTLVPEGVVEAGAGDARSSQPGP